MQYSYRNRAERYCMMSQSHRIMAINCIVITEYYVPGSTYFAVVVWIEGPPLLLSYYSSLKLIVAQRQVVVYQTDSRAYFQSQYSYVRVACGGTCWMQCVKAPWPTNVHFIACRKSLDAWSRCLLCHTIRYVRRYSSLYSTSRLTSSSSWNILLKYVQHAESLRNYDLWRSHRWHITYVCTTVT